VVGLLASTVKREYIDPQKADEVDASLRRWLAGGRYAEAGTPEALATLLTGDLFALTHDKHLAVGVVRGAVPGSNERTENGRRSNFGVQKVEILPGNIGYVNLTWFYRPGEARDAISAAMRMLRNADALIVDLRANGGGSPDTVALVASYFFDTTGLALFDIVHRSGESAQEYRTEAVALPERNGLRPVCVLTSEHTFSGGEGLAFILQERRRAEVIGETTAGAANPGRPYPLIAGFEVVVPNGMVRGAVSGGNWEGSGVIPDVKTRASEALDAAQGRLRRRLREAEEHAPASH
jgi:C-terminal processing protease CtpA/Prc